MNVSNIITRNYKYFIPLAGQKNKPNTNPIKPNFQKAKMDVKLYVIEDYIKNDAFTVRKNKPNSNPISEKPKMNANVFITKDYRKNDASGPKKTNPKQTQFKACPERIEFTLSVIEGNGPISIQKSWPKTWLSDKMHKFIIDKL